MTTVLGLIKSSMRKIGALSKGENPSNDEANDALQVFNDLLASLSNDSMVVYSRVTESFPLSGGVSSYTIGSGGTFDTTRPIKIVSAYVRQDTIDYPLDVITDQNYSEIVLKTTQSIPQFIHYDNNHPLGIIKFYPVPIGGTLFLVSEKPLTQFTSLNQDVDLPAGWNRFLIYNGAVELASEYGQPVLPEIYEIAKESKAEIRHAIMVNKPMQWTTGRYSESNIYSGWNN